MGLTHALNRINYRDTKMRCQMKSNLWIFLFLSAVAFADAPSKNWSFIWKNAYQLKNFDCSKLSDELENGVVAEARKLKDVYQHWFFMCGATESDSTLFNINPELLLSAKNEAGIQQINDFLQLHQNEVIQGISLNFLKIQKFIVQTKIQANKLTPARAAHLEILGSAERIYLADYYSEFEGAVTKAKNALKGTDIQGVLDYINNGYGQAVEMDFKNNWLPKANSIVERLRISYFLEDGTAKRALSIHQYTRDCKTATQNTCL